MLLRLTDWLILGALCKSSSNRIFSYKDALQRTGCESIETNVRRRRLLWLGVLLRMGAHRVLKRIISGELEKAGQRGPGEKDK